MTLARRLIMVAVFGLLLVACDGSDATPTTPQPTPTTTVTTRPGSTTTGVTTTTDAPGESALDTRVAWLAEVFDAGELGEDEYTSVFTADFVQNVPYVDFMAVVRQVSGTGSGWQVEEFESRQGTSATVLLGSEQGQRIRANISLETVVPHRIAGLLVQPADPPTLDDPPGDLESAAERLSRLGDLELAVMEADAGRCRPVFSAGEDAAAPVGSAIKLYVLAAVVDAVETGGLSWDTEVPISDDLKSIPTGVLQDEPEGATFSLREYAEAMIAFSDNTATDHLVDLVGREAVESALSRYGMEDPALNIPFMDTMDLTALKVGPASGLATQWLEAGESRRREILDQISDIRPADIPLADFDRPVMPDRLEWFATPADLCRVLAALIAEGSPLTQILSINPGLPTNDTGLEVLAFKGGSEPGMVAMSWMVERDDGRRFVVAGSVVDPEEDFDQLEAVLLFGAARDLVADLP